MTDSDETKNALSHSCKGVCSGWQAGYDAREREMSAEVEHWRTKYGAYVDKWCDANREGEQLKADISSREQTYYVALTNMKEQCAKLEAENLTLLEIAGMEHVDRTMLQHNLAHYRDMCEKMADALLRIKMGYAFDVGNTSALEASEALADYGAFLEGLK